MDDDEILPATALPHRHPPPPPPSPPSFLFPSSAAELGTSGTSPGDLSLFPPEHEVNMPPYDYEIKGPHRRLGSFSSTDDYELQPPAAHHDERFSKRLSTHVSKHMSRHLSVFTALPPVPAGYDDELKDFVAYPPRHSVFRQSLFPPPVPQLPQEHQPPQKETPSEPAEPEYPGTKTRLLIVMAILMAAFLTALDRTIIATAIPQITDEFNSLGDIGWYGSAFLLTASCFQLILGRVYSFNSPKYVFLVCMAIFELGSALCGAAPNSVTLIVGRAVAGLGTAGIMSGAIIMMIATIPLNQRPMYQGLFGAVFGASSIVGPLIGGAFTTNINWRWCFYINLPIGGLAIVILFFVLPATVPTEPGKSFKEQLASLDLLGEFFLFPSIICLLLALQWGGSKYPWGDWRIIVLFAVFGATFIAFCVVQALMQKNATIKASVIKNRSIYSAMFYAFTLAGTMIMAVYFLPLWFQAIKNVSALQSGLDALPSIISSVFGSIFAGVLVSKLGYYTPFMILGSVMGAVGLGLMSTFTIDSGSGQWIGYQVIFGFGLGAGMQQGSLVAQTVLKKEDANIGVSLLFLVQQIGSAIFLSVGENIFSEQLLKNLKKLVPGMDPSKVTGSGATDLRKIVPPALLKEILTAYNGAITQLFLAGMILACISLVGACGVEFISVKGKNKKSLRRSQISKPVTEMSADLDAKPAPLKRYHTVKHLPPPPSHPASEKAIEAGFEVRSERISQAPTAVSDTYSVDPPKYVPQARVRHVAELARNPSRTNDPDRYRPPQRKR